MMRCGRCWSWIPAYVGETERRMSLERAKRNGDLYAREDLQAALGRRGEQASAPEE